MRAPAKMQSHLRRKMNLHQLFNRSYLPARETQRQWDGKCYAVGVPLSIEGTKAKSILSPNAGAKQQPGVVPHELVEWRKQRF